MYIIIGILAAAVILLAGVVYQQHGTILYQRKKLIEALDWIEPDALVLGEEWRDDG